ncbi:VOC family protein [Pedobacter kyonggii]|uniref:VOC family protein n=1 Tax=Pedobacter kyonggii TaxID=1926871 RepID=A0A4Q9HCH5_9SPHI|nr:VOC family protein [Pedobacter kyonggii]TBO42090.1 VOC family protein [Pedobacter kyonggii]
MDDKAKKKYSIGSIVSADLTVPNATVLKDFYKQVIGWTSEELKMEGNQEYSDYILKDSDGNWTAGICHAQGVNSGIPPQWIVYINVKDIKDSVEKCKKLGGKVIKETFDNNGNYIYAMLEDPFGAVLAVTHVANE